MPCVSSKLASGEGRAELRLVVQENGRQLYFTLTLEQWNAIFLAYMETEATFHAFCRCPMARDLWSAMAEACKIPAMDDMIQH
jgi:hypothetical protein